VRPYIEQSWSNHTSSKCFQLEQAPIEWEWPLSYQCDLLRLGVKRIHDEILLLWNDYRGDAQHARATAQW
jgi:hypothetical protein